MSLPAGTYWPFEISYLDAGNEVGRFGAFGAIVLISDDAGNIEEKTDTFATLITATDAITLGARVKTRYINEVISLADQPTNGATRELKLLVQYRDATTGQRFTCTVPTLDPSLPDYVENINVKDAIEIDSPTEILNFVAAFEAFAISPVTHNAVEVVGLRVVGRNN